MPALGKFLVLLGLALAAVGACVWFFGGRGWFDWVGRLPGDIRIERDDGGGFYFPVTTCILGSLVLSLVLALVRKLAGG